MQILISRLVISSWFDKNVRWIQLSVVYSLRMKIFHSQSYLKHQINRDRKGESVLLPWTTYLFDVCAEGFTHQFHDQETLFLLLIRETAEKRRRKQLWTLVSISQIFQKEISQLPIMLARTGLRFLLKLFD